MSATNEMPAGLWADGWDSCPWVARAKSFWTYGPNGSHKAWLTALEPLVERIDIERRMDHTERGIGVEVRVGEKKP